MINFLLGIAFSPIALAAIPLFRAIFPRPFVGFFFKMVKKVFNENTKLLKSYLTLKGE
jgi:hypothetical protein